MLPLPRLSFTGLVDYVALAAGIAVGFALFRAPMNQLENAFKRQG
jgi:hypothetical protein